MSTHRENMSEKSIHILTIGFTFLLFLFFLYATYRLVMVIVAG